MYVFVFSPQKEVSTGPYVLCVPLPAAVVAESWAASEVFFFTGCGTYKDHSLGGLLPRVFQFHKYMALSPPDTHSAVH